MNGPWLVRVVKPSPFRKILCRCCQRLQAFWKSFLGFQASFLPAGLHSQFFFPSDASSHRSHGFTPPVPRKTKPDYHWIPKITAPSPSLSLGAETTAANPPHMALDNSLNSILSGPQPAAAICTTCHGPGTYRKAHTSIIKCLDCINLEAHLDQSELLWKENSNLESPPFGGPVSAHSRQARLICDCQPIALEGEEAPPPIDILLLPSEESREVPPHSTVPSTALAKNPNGELRR